MPETSLKKKLIRDIETLPEKKVKEVVNFIEYLKLREDAWFIDFVNKRGRLAKVEKKRAGNSPNWKSYKKNINSI